MERDDLHREVLRTQGKLTSCFGYDAMGRKSWQFASTMPSEKLSQILNPGDNSLLVDHAQNPIHRRYEYDPAGELIRTLDKLRGEIKYEYEANGQLHSRDTGKLVHSEEFRYDAAANRLNFNTSQFDQVKDNRIKRWRDQEYTYDAWGNLIEKRVGLNKLQTFSYDCENRLVKAETLVNGKLERTGTYRYDSLGRRIGKTSEINGQTEHKHFLWQGLRMLREETPWQSSLYIYEPGSYAPLARVDQQEGETEQKLYYFHTDQIGTPLEVTDVDGSIVWQATYKAWGEIEALAVNEVEQNLRFQGQYFDDETGLHYNTFRYYDPGVGRFITQDPIGLGGGNNLYGFVINPIKWVDPLGLMPLAMPGKQGHHMVPHKAATDLNIKPFNSANGVPSMYFNEPGQWTGVEHSGMHGYNGIASDTKPLVNADAIRSKMTNQQWVNSLEAHYNNPEIAHYRGDLRLVEAGRPGKLLAANVSPAKAWEHVKAWAASKGYNASGCGG
jgi:RHS repeat-associated protein